MNNYTKFHINILLCLIFLATSLSRADDYQGVDDAGSVTDPSQGAGWIIPSGENWTIELPASASGGYGHFISIGGNGVYLKTGNATNLTSLISTGGIGEDGGVGGTGIFIETGNLINRDSVTANGGAGYSGGGGEGLQINSGGLINYQHFVARGGDARGIGGFGGQGVLLQSGKLSNIGTITASGGTASGLNVRGGAGIMLNNGSMVNSGTLSLCGGDADSQGIGGYGLVNVHGSGIVNNGSITAVGGVGKYSGQGGDGVTLFDGDLMGGTVTAYGGNGIASGIGGVGVSVKSLTANDMVYAAGGNAIEGGRGGAGIIVDEKMLNYGNVAVRSGNGSFAGNGIIAGSFINGNRLSLENNGSSTQAALYIRGEEFTDSLIFSGGSILATNGGTIFVNAGNTMIASDAKLEISLADTGLLAKGKSKSVMIIEHSRDNDGKITGSFSLPKSLLLGYAEYRSQDQKEYGLTVGRIASASSFAQGDTRNLLLALENGLYGQTIDAGNTPWVNLLSNLDYQQNANALAKMSLDYRRSVVPDAFGDSFFQLRDILYRGSRIAGDNLGGNTESSPECGICHTRTDRLWIDPFWLQTHSGGDSEISSANGRMLGLGLGYQPAAPGTSFYSWFADGQTKSGSFHTDSRSYGFAAAIGKRFDRHPLWQPNIRFRTGVQYSELEQRRYDYYNVKQDSAPDAWSFTAGSEVSHSFDHGAWRITPAVTLDYSGVWMSESKENGGSLALATSFDAFHSLRAALTTTLTRRIAQRSDLSLRTGCSFEFLDRHATFTSQAIGSKSIRFATFGREEGRLSTWVEARTSHSIGRAKVSFAVEGALTRKRHSFGTSFDIALKF